MKKWDEQDNIGESCLKCSSERLVRSSDPEACGKILEVNGPFKHCHGKVDPSSFNKHCISDLCLHGGLQSALSLSPWQIILLSAFPIRLQFMPGGVSDSAVSVNVLPALLCN